MISEIQIILWMSIGSGLGALIDKVTGKGGHGASPHLTVDPVLASAQIITALQSIVSRNISPFEAVVIGISHIQAGSAFNIIPADANMEGTIRCFSPEIRELGISRLKTIVNGIADAMNCNAEVEVSQITLPVVNDKRLTGIMQKIVRDLFPTADICSTYKSMVSEDMSYLMNDIPGCFVLIGSANSQLGKGYSHHNPRFDIDESCMPDIVTVVAQGSIEILKSHIQI